MIPYLSAEFIRGLLECWRRPERCPDKANITATAQVESGRLSAPVFKTNGS